MRTAWCVVLVLLSALPGCRPASVEDRRTHWGGWLDLSVAGSRYYGMYCYQTAEPDGRVVAASGVLLMPWDDRPECCIAIQGRDTLVEIRGQKKTFSGRPLLQLASPDAQLKVVAKEIDLSHYSSRQGMTEAVKGLLSAPPTPDR